MTDKNSNFFNFPRYLVVFAAFLFLFGLPFILNYWFLYRAGEVQSFSLLVDKQVREGVLYGSGLNGNSFQYKLKLAERVQPDVLVVGASRVMQYRKEAFTVPMVNMGGAFQELDEGSRLIREILKFKHKPKVILLGFDYWWLNKNFRLHEGQFDFYADETDMPVFKHYKPWLWLYEGKITPAEYIKILKGGPFYNDVTSYSTLGLASIKSSEGSRPDGSYLYLYTMSHNKNKEFLFEEIREIKDGKNVRVNYGIGDFVDNKKLEQFKQIVSEIQQAGIKLVIVLPPIMPIFLTEVLKYNPDYLKSYGQHWAEFQGIEVYDMNLFTSSDFVDCEYGDQWHPGEVAQLRVLLEILKRNPQSVLKDVVNVDEIKSAVERNKGRFMVDWDADKWKVKEIDYFNLGCKK